MDKLQRCCFLSLCLAQIVTRTGFYIRQTYILTNFNEIFQSHWLSFFMALKPNHAYNLWSFGQKITEMMFFTHPKKRHKCINDAVFCLFCSLWRPKHQLEVYPFFINGLHITTRRFFLKKERAVFSVCGQQLV